MKLLCVRRSEPKHLAHRPTPLPAVSLPQQHPNAANCRLRHRRRRVLFGVFLTVDLGQQCDKVSHGGELHVMWMWTPALPRTRCVAGTMVDHYDEGGLERQLLVSVSYLLSDETPFNGHDWT